MAIQDRELKRNFRVFDKDQFLKDILDQLKEGEDVYLLVELEDHKFAAVHLADLRQTLGNLARFQDRIALLEAPIGQILEAFAAPAVDQASTELWQAEQVRRKIPGQSLVVLSAGQVAGLLAPKPKDTVVYRSGGPVMGVLGAEAEAEEEPSKKINVQMFDQDLNRVRPEEKPLQLSQTYTLVFDVADQSKPGSLVSEAYFRYKWRAEEQEARLTVRLESEDFNVLTEPQKLNVPRLGESNKARFDVKPIKEGRGVINALFFKEDTFIQLLTLKFTVVEGALFTEDSAGRTLAAAFSVRPRNLNLIILEGADGYQFVMTGAVAATAKLPITPQSLAARVTDLRRVLQEQIVFMKDPLSGQTNYLYSLDIPPSSSDLAMQKMADLGYGLYREIFYSFDADAQANLMGDRLRAMVRGEETLKIQIFSQRFMFPWGLLYMADEDEFDLEQVHPEWFIGLKHIVEQIPLQQTMQVTDPKINSRAGLTISVNVNTDIDQQMGAPLVASQLAYWKNVAKGGSATLIQRTTASELLEALKSSQDTADQIFYFYCHAASKDLAEGGPDASMLVLSGNERLTLKDLKRQAPHKRILPGEPLIFINACESAELSPLFYDGFVPYFLAKGARGVIGTECETPALFAVEWARRFFDRFLNGEPLGQVFLGLRREFFFKHNNILGLLYSLYVDGDTQVAPALKGLTTAP